MDLAARGVKRVVFSRRYNPPIDESIARLSVIDHHLISWEYKPIKQVEEIELDSLPDRPHT
jgi:hypothetical protein